jgi:hypothetical protein
MATNLERLRSIQVSALSRESAFDTHRAVDSLIRWSSGVIPSQEVHTINDNDLIGGTEEPTEAEVFARSLAFPFAQKRVKPHTLAFIAAYALGSITTTVPAGGTHCHKHVIIPLIDDTMLKTFSMEAKYKTGIQKLFTGCFVDSFELTFKRGANRFVDISGQAYGSGTVTDGTASTTEISEGGLNAADAAIWLDDTTYDGSTANDLNLTTSDLAGNPASEGCNAIGLTWGYKNNVDLENAYCIGSGLYIGTAERSARSQTLSYTRLWQDESFGDGLLAQTEYAMQVRVKNAAIDAITDSGLFYGMQLTFPLLQIAKRSRGEQNGRQTETLEFHVLQHATHGSVILDVFNRQSTYAYSA